MATGTQATFLTHALRATVATVSHPFWVVLSRGEGTFDYVRGVFVSYDTAIDEASILRRDLQAQTLQTATFEELFAENQRLRDLLEYQREQRGVEGIHARAYAQAQGTLWIDRGTRHGVKPFTIVVTEKGVVGYVAQVFPANAVVFTLHHAQCELGAMIKGSRVKGLIVGSGSKVSNICQMLNIDTKDTVRVGDVVVTSEESRYPTGLRIGKVEAVDTESGSLQKIAYIVPYADPYSVDDVYLIQLSQFSADELSGPEGEGAQDSMDTVSSAQSVQDRNAP